MEGSTHHGNERILLNRCSQITHLLLEVVRPHFPDSLSHACWRVVEGVLRV
jgi:hypothetical protein